MILDITEVGAVGGELTDSLDFPSDDELNTVDEEYNEVEENTVLAEEDDQMAAETAVSDEAPEFETESIKHVEEIIKSAPGFEMPVDQYDEDEIETNVSHDTLDSLLDDYVQIIQEGKGETEPDTGIVDTRKNPTEIAEEVENIEQETAQKGATATMAEIYVSQGFITRGIEIYHILLNDDPDNEQYKLRLEELESMHDQFSEDS